MDNPYLLLWLESPMQSWGHDSKFGRRDSLAFPTKSGVLGLICCARGAGGDEIEWLKAWTDLEFQLVAYVLQGRDGQTLPRQPLLRDFHMVGSGYNDQDPWESLLIPKTSTGKKAVGGGTKITYRYYLQDMAYAVAVQVPASLVDEITQALVNPVWDLYLGRKNCVPTEFISQGAFGSSEQALQKADQLAAEKGRAFAFRVLQGEHEGEVVTLTDVPLQFGEHKRYGDRQVTIQNWE